jgi:hypothetical protein
MKKHIASILFLCLLSVSQSIAQSHSIKRLGIEQGLSNNYVISIAQCRISGPERIYLDSYRKRT